MTERQEIKLRVACAALQGGMSAEDVYYSLYQDEENAPDLFPSIDERIALAEDKSQSNTKVVY